MFTEVRQAILPLALRRLHRKDDLERTCVLIEFAGRHWRDRRPFELLIVAPARDADFVRGRLAEARRVNVTVRPESDFFSPFSRFFMLTGWFRQQIIKLYVPAKLGFGGYLTLDSDVACVGDFDATTFVHEGRALSRWEPKRHHEWWRSAARMVGVPYDAAPTACRSRPTFSMATLPPRRWSISSTAGRPGDDTGLRGDPPARHDSVDGIFALHQRRRAQRQPVRLSRPLGSLLFLGHPARLGAVLRLGRATISSGWQSSAKGSDPGGKFIIVQSHARIPVEQVREYCFSFAT